MVNPIGPDIYPGPTNQEHDTGLRNSLAYGLIGSTDRYYHHPAGDKRIVTYPRTDRATEQLRDKLLEQQLILGRPIESTDINDEAFVIPPSARPLAYESSSSAQGSFSYSDDKLFPDLGYMLAKVLELDPKRYIIKGDIGHSVALTDYVHETGRLLFFVPGVERLLVPIEENEDVLGYYANTLRAEFGPRFGDFAMSLRIGFAHGLAETRDV
jgi:hypothetical protein